MFVLNFPTQCDWSLLMWFFQQFAIHLEQFNINQVFLKNSMSLLLFVFFFHRWCSRPAFVLNILAIWFYLLLEKDLFSQFWTQGSSYSILNSYETGNPRNIMNYLKSVNSIFYLHLVIIYLDQSLWMFLYDTPTERA